MAQTSGSKPGIAKQYRTQDFLSRFSSLAQTNQYQVTFGISNNVSNPSDSGAQGETITPLKDFLAARGMAFDFQLEQSGIMATSAQLPGSFFATTEQTAHYYGITQKNAYRRTFDDASFTFYVDSAYKQIQFLESWMDYISSSNSAGQLENGAAKNAFYEFNYPDNYKHSIYLTKFNKDVNRQDMITYTFINAFPTNISSMEVSYGAASLLQCTCSFTYDRYLLDKPARVQTSQPVPGQGGTGPETGQGLKPEATKALNTEVTPSSNGPKNNKPTVDPSTGAFRRNINRVTAEDAALLAEEANFTMF